MKLRIRAGEKWSQSARVPLKGWTLLLVDNALEGRPHLVKVRSSRVLLASASGLARLFVPLLMDKSLASDSQLLPSFFRESGRTMTCACEPMLVGAHICRTSLSLQKTSLRLLTQMIQVLIMCGYCEQIYTVQYIASYYNIALILKTLI